VSSTDVDPKIDEVQKRLAAEFADVVGFEKVARCVADARAQYADANIDAYVPMFVARRARQMLRAATPHE
jgi:hypothetical protein